MPNAKIVYVVDDELSVCQNLAPMLSELHYEVHAFATADEFLACVDADAVSCVLLDVHMPDRNGLDVQEHMKGCGIDVPVIFLTCQGDIAMAVRAMKGGAVDFLTKPVGRVELIQALALAHARSAERLEARRRRLAASERLSRLTAREREVLELVLAGRRNKQIAAALSSQEATVKVHRSRLMRKLETRSLAELLRFAQALHTPPGAASDRREQYGARRVPLEA